MASPELIPAEDMRILVVDDESINRSLLIHMLEKEGYGHCAEAASGKEAIGLAQTFQPDLVLLDVMMPDMSGYDVAPLLKKMAKDSYLPIIFITSLEDKESLITCLEVGGDDFTSKPFDRLILAAKIRAHSRIRALSQRIDQQHQALRFFQQNVDREHAIVEHIFSNAIVNPKRITRFFDYKISPATEFNGDVFLCEGSPGGGLYFLVGDFTGHGLASAIGALPVTRSFQSMAALGLSVSEMASTLNAILLQLLPADMFFAAAIVEVTSNGTRFNIWNGGLPQMILKSSSGQLVRHFPSRHMALGILDENDFEDDCYVFDAQAGDQMLVYTDGLIEIKNDDGHMLEEAGVEAWFCEGPDISADTLYQRARDFMGKTGHDDDLSLAIFTCKPLPGMTEDVELSPLPFSFTCEMGPDVLRSDDALESILSMINSQKGLNWIRSDLFTVLTELFNNALEHGLLKLDSKLKSSPEGFMDYYKQRETRLAELEEGAVTMSATFSPASRSLTLSVRDTGSGFNVANVNNPDIDDSFGRGIALLKDICSEVHFSEGGTCTTVVMEL